MCDHHLPGKVCIPDPAHTDPDGTGVPVISLDANNGDVFIGGPPGGFGHRGRLILTDADGNQTFEIDGATGTTSQSGDIILKDSEGNERIRISGQSAEIIIKNADEVQVMNLGREGDVIAGGGGLNGDLELRNADNNLIFHLAADEQNLVIQKANGDKVVELGRQGNLILGGAGDSGDILVRNSNGDSTIRLDGNTGNVTLGDNDQDGDLVLRNSSGDDTITLDGETGNIQLNGEIMIQDWTISVPDHVFAADYNLRGLDDLAAYIGKHHHLPEIPSAEEVARKGINLTSFCMQLLKKIEELSLYAIQQQDVIQQQGHLLARIEQNLSEEVWDRPRIRKS